MEEISVFSDGVALTNKEKMGFIHSMSYYAEITKFLQKMGVGEDELTNRALNNVDFDRIHISAEVADDLKSITVGRAKDGDGVHLMTGTKKSDLMFGTVGDDKMKGGKYIDHLYGRQGDDVLMGGSARDYLFGGVNDDTLVGGKGGDFLEGGFGSDAFDFNGRNELSSLRKFTDKIINFQSGKDVIDLSDIDANSNVKGNQTFKYIGIDEFSGSAGELGFHEFEHGIILRMDIDGDGNADEIIVLKSSTEISFDDFIL